MLRKIAVAYLVCQLFIIGAQAQVTTNRQLLTRAAFTHKEKEIKAYEHAATLARQKGWPLRLMSPKGSIALLVDVDPFGYPVYIATDNNITAAATTGASQLWNGGTTGLSLSGASAAVKDKLAVWDGGSILNTHVELKGRILQRDVPSALSDHSTHVAGTMIGLGINPLAKGMANGAQSLIAYDFNNHLSEIMSEASGLLISNHSYGTKAGWSYNNNRWEFLGRADENEDYKFGYYNSEAQLFDSIAYNAPFYLIVKSAGNNRGETGPAIGQAFYRYNANGQMVDAGLRPAGISSNDGYDVIPTYGTSKNILTVGAVKGLPFGYNKSEEVIMSSFSSWGPTDDGRIKPDIVADGVDVLSSISTSDNAYESMNGTSMASPNASGSLLLLQEYWARLHNGAFMRSATLKALAIHTANEAGDAPGPDYRFGWGVLNVAKAADVITAQNTGNHLISENTLNNNSTFTTTVVASGKSPLVATMVWTDPKGTVETTNLLNNRTPKLVNDLDIRIRKGTTVYKPWILDPAAPTSSAMTGDNILDNVERIDINNPVPGETYTIEITHKGTLDRGSQAYSLVVSGVGGQPYCTSAPTSNTGARIDSVSFGAIQKRNTAGCTTYTNYTTTTTTLQANQVLPISVNLNSCDAASADMMVKVFLDLNNNGNFTDANELLATSGVISGSGVFTGTITLPGGITPGNSSILRIVAQQTALASDIVPCGTYGNGETQDYRVVFGLPTSDISIADIAYPTSGCGNTSVYPVIGIRNNGSVDRTGVPVKLLAKNGATVVATLTGTYPGRIAAGATVAYTFQAPLALAAGNTYTLQAISQDGMDQNNSNDTMSKAVSISTTTKPAGTAEVCGTSTNLRVANPNALNSYFWYTSPSATTPIASGAFAITATIPADKTYYVGTGVKGSVGLSTNAGFTGGYLNSSSNYMKYSSSVPVFLESVRLYSKSGGQVDFMVADITSQSGSSYSYIPLSTTTVDVLTSSPTPAAGTQAGYDATDTGAVYTLNMLLPAGDHAIIMRMKDATTNLYRNNGITGNPYPFSFLDVISFTGNSATTTGNPQYYQGFYYYMYDVKVRTLDCISDRMAVVANVAPTPVISQSGDSLVSNITSGNQWYLNGNAIAGAGTSSFRPTQSGTYTVSVYSPAGCMQSSNSINYVFTAVPVVVDPQFNLQAVPNPNNGSFTLSFNAARKENIGIELLSSYGQLVYQRAIPNFIGAYSEQLHLEHIAPGMYVLKVQYGAKVQYKKMVIE